VAVFRLDQMCLSRFAEYDGVIRGAPATSNPPLVVMSCGF